MNYIDILNTLEMGEVDGVHSKYFDAILEFSKSDKTTVLFILALLNPSTITALRENFITGFLLGTAFSEKLQEVEKLEDLVK